jgi:hypothetical protein
MCLTPAPQSRARSKSGIAFLDRERTRPSIRRRDGVWVVSKRPSVRFEGLPPWIYSAPLPHSKEMKNYHFGSANFSGHRFPSHLRVDIVT